MIVAGMIWFGASVGNIVSPFFYKTSQAPSYHLGIGSLLAANIAELVLFAILRYCFMFENRRKERVRAEMRAAGTLEEDDNLTAFADMTDKENPMFEYVY